MVEEAGGQVAAQGVEGGARSGDGGGPSRVLNEGVVAAAVTADGCGLAVTAHDGQPLAELGGGVAEPGLERGHVPVPDRAGELAEAAKVVVGGTAGGNGEELVLFVEYDAASQAGKEGRNVGRSLASHALDAALPSPPVTTHLKGLQQSV